MAVRSLCRPVRVYSLEQTVLGFFKPYKKDVICV